MTKTLKYSGLAAMGALVIFVFVTAKSYAQLAGASVFYVLLAYLAFKIFPRSEAKAVEFRISKEKHKEPPVGHEIKREKVDVVDIDRRTFLKLIGVTGVSFFLFSLLGRRTEDLLFGKSSGAFVAPQDAAGDGVGSTNLTPSSSYKITEIDDGVVTYYGFVNKEGGWLIMREDSETSSFRYAKGDSGFSANWAGRRSLEYDYYHKLF